MRRLKRCGIAVAAWVLQGSLLSQSWAENFVPEATVYIHHPEIFADLSAGSFDAHASQPYRNLRWWYVRVDNRLGDQDFESLARWVAEKHIAGLDLSGQPAVWAPAIGDLARQAPQELKYLNLEQTQADDAAMTQVAQLPYLESLHVSGDITDKGARDLASLSRLMDLSLAGTKITDQGIAALSGLKDLDTLDLGDTAVTDKGIATLRTAPLKRLRLGQGITDQGIKTLSKMKTLGQLNLTQTQVSDNGLAALRRLPLHTLFLGPSVSDAGMKTVAKLRGLRRLDVTGARMTDAGAAPLAALKGIEELAFGHTGVTNAALERLAGLKHLRYLEFSDTKATVDGLAALSRIPSLEVISFSATGPLPLGRLKVLSKLPKLRTIIINGRPLGIEEMDFIKGRHQPQALDWLLDRLIPSAWADTGSIPPTLTDSTNVLTIKPLQDKTPPVTKLAGLIRIHNVESELDHDIPAISQPAIDTDDENSKNFMGEYSVGVEGKKK